MERLMVFVKSIVDLPKQEETNLENIVRERPILKGDTFIREGEVPKKFAFVHQGLFRYYYLKDKGMEYTKNFIPEGNFISAYSAMIAQKPSFMFIEALTDSILYELNFADWITLKKNHPCWNHLLVKMLEKAFVIKEKRERELLLLNAQQRYENFKRDFPDLEGKVKQHLIASYLGISPVSLSRIRKNTNINIG